MKFISKNDRTQCVPVCCRLGGCGGGGGGPSSFGCSLAFREAWLCCVGAEEGRQALTKCDRKLSPFLYSRATTCLKRERKRRMLATQIKL